MSPRRQQSSSSSSSGSEAERRRQKKRKDKEKDKERGKEKDREKDKEKKDKEKDRAKEKDSDRDRDRRRRSSSEGTRSTSCPRRSRSKRSGSRKSSSRRSRSRKSHSNLSRSKRSRSKKSRSKRSRSKRSRSKRSRSRKSHSKRSRSKRSRSKRSRSKRSRSRRSRSKRSRSKRRSRRSRSKRSRAKRSRSKRYRTRRSRSKRSSSKGSSKSSSSERKKEKRKKKKEASPASAGAGEPAAEAKAVSTPAPTAVAKKPLGDLVELQKQLEEERDKLQLFILKAKQEHEEKRETDDRRERREREYYQPSWGEPVGPENRFLLEGEVGRGAFSTVFRCRDALKGGEYAVKFIRMNAMLRKATEKEVKLMRRLRTLASEQDPDGARCFLTLAGPEVFEHAGHLAVVFPLQRCDLRSGLQKYGQGKGLPLPTVQCYAGDIFLALRALRKVKIIHSDVKPDNLLITPDRASVKLADFGSAMGVAERVKTDYVQPRFYRAPEVILGQVYGCEIDIWSAALTLFELATGHIVFQGRTNNDMIHEMLKVNGAFPKHFATSGEFASRHFTSDGDFKCQEPGNGAPEAAIPMSKFPKPPQPPQPFRQMLEERIKETPAGSDAGRHQARLQRLADLLSRCVAPVPAERLKPEKALAHAFLKNNAK